jgi:hypothetical protein
VNKKTAQKTALQKPKSQKESNEPLWGVKSESFRDKSVRVFASCVLLLLKVVREGNFLPKIPLVV